MLGWRPVVSQNPLKYADHYEWLSWDTVDMRRRQVGSALHKLFADGVVGGGPLRTVGIYSGNCPGKCRSSAHCMLFIHPEISMAGCRFSDTCVRDCIRHSIRHLGQGYCR